MNRIKLHPLAKIGLDVEPTTSNEQEAVSPPSVFSEDKPVDLLDYSLFIPQHYEAQYAYPLVVWLHSDGADHSQLLKMMPQLSRRNFAAVSVGSADRHEDSCWQQDAHSIGQTAEQLQVAIEHAKLRLNIDDGRIFIAGSGSGGTMAMRMAFSFPDWFAGIACLNGEIPVNLRPLANWQNCRQVPVFWAHARRSKSFEESTLCVQLRLLHIAGFSIMLKQYPCDDQLNARVFSDMNDWIMETIAENSPADSIVR